MKIMDSTANVEFAAERRATPLPLLYTLLLGLLFDFRWRETSAALYDVLINHKGLVHLPT